MRVFLGMILGSALTILAVFMIDSMSTTATSVAGAPTTTRQMVNWDVVGMRVRGLRDELRQLGARVQDGWNRLTG
jgi:hypothetical protein